jgi:phospholipid-binding lipoprotein MlaA
MPRFASPRRSVLAIAGVIGLAACSPAPIAVGISDPHEEANRRVHEANLQLDQALFGDLAQGNEETAPGPARKGITNFASNLALPGLIVNKFLQGRFDDAAHNSVRFVINTVMGVGGLFDPASEGGIEERGTDFGETMHVWGIPEGDYVVLPFFGPSTERDTVGKVIDLFTNPLSYAIPKRFAAIPPAAKIVAQAGNRITYASTLNAVMYESADAYSAMRLYYLDSRRYQLSGGSATEALYDIYEESYE